MVSSEYRVHVSSFVHITESSNEGGLTVLEKEVESTSRQMGNAERRLGVRAARGHGVASPRVEGRDGDRNGDLHTAFEVGSVNFRLADGECVERL